MAARAAQGAWRHSGTAPCVAGALAALAGFAPLAAQSRLWAPEERALLSDFSYVEAVAASPFTVFAATRRGLLLYDRAGRRWQLPITRLDGYPESPVRVALADVGADAVWLGLADGYARYEAATRRWERVPLPGGVSDFIMDADDPAGGVWALVVGRWVNVSRFGPAGFAAGLPPPGRRLRPLSVAAALAQAPMADAMRALILTDPRLRQHRFTAAARSSDQAELFFGTDGGGLIRLDPQMGTWESLSYGLPGARAGALALAPDGVWAATDDAGADRSGGGVTWIATDLSTTDEREGRTGATVGAVVDPRALVASGRALWLASAVGLDRVDPASLRARRVELVDEVFALAPAPEGVWVGTRTGVWRAGEEDVTHVAAGPPVLALRRLGDSLWVGTSAGLAVLPPGGAAVVPLGPGRGAPALAGAVVALSQAADTLVVATPDQLAWRDPSTGAWTVLRPQLPLGRITRLAGDPAGVWVGGTGGLAHWAPGTARFVALRVPGDLPGAVRDVVVGGPWVWVATDDGVVRLARDAVLGP